MSIEITNKINRSALILSPKQAFFDMLVNELNCEKIIARDGLADNSSHIFLTAAEIRSKEEALILIRKNFRIILEDEIEAWAGEPDEWPEEITWEQFQDFFSITFQSIVIDTAVEDSMYEDFDDDEYFDE